MKVFLLYDYTDQPWGGINTFFRNFAENAKVDIRVDLTADPLKADVILTSGHYSGPGKMLNGSALQNICHGRNKHNPLGLISKQVKAKVVFRVDGLRLFYAGKASKADDILIKNLSNADAVVFQSQYSKGCFDECGIKYPDVFTTINNGAHECFQSIDNESESGHPILISNSWSTNRAKGFETIAVFSELEGVEVRHIGRWPDDVACRNVVMLGEKPANEIPEILSSGHFLLFPSENEACPNVVVEALACGLPVLYHNSGGNLELCHGDRFGIPLPAYDGKAPDYVAFLETAMGRRPELITAIQNAREEFLFSACYDSYVRFFEEILA